MNESVNILRFDQPLLVLDCGSNYIKRDILPPAAIRHLVTEYWATETKNQEAPTKRNHDLAEIAISAYREEQRAREELVDEIFGTRD